MRWLGLFTKKTFRKHIKLIFPHRDFIICIVSLAIFHPHLSSAFFHPHFIIRVFPSAFYHPHFIIRIFPSAFYHPHFSIRIFPSAFFFPPSAIRRHPVLTLQRPLFNTVWCIVDYFEAICRHCNACFRSSLRHFSFAGIKEKKPSYRWNVYG